MVTCGGCSLMYWRECEKMWNLVWSPCVWSVVLVNFCGLLDAKTEGPLSWQAGGIKGSYVYIWSRSEKIAWCASSAAGNSIVLVHSTLFLVPSHVTWNKTCVMNNELDPLLVLWWSLSCCWHYYGTWHQTNCRGNHYFCCWLEAM